MSKISIDEVKIDWFLNHAVENVYPSKEALREKLMTGEQISVYLGVDPTGPTLHLGHMVTIQKVAELQAMGHKVILLMGDFTAMIGDPTDKSATRRQLTHEEVLSNLRLYKDQAARFLTFTGQNAAQIQFNSEWLAKMKFEDVIQLASHFTVQQMLERDMFEKRMDEQKAIHLHEFLYPLMQGYDSVAMDVDLEVGGNDQTFNMLAGRTLMKELKGKEKFVLTARLLADAGGKKMGKTEGNMIALIDTPEDMFGKIMSWTDGMILPGFEICTDASAKEVEDIRRRIESGENPMVLKRELAKRIVTWLCGEKEADAASEAFSRIHQQGEKPEEIKEIKIEKSEVSLIDALVQSKLVSSKSEARRQIEQGGVKVDDVVIRSVDAICHEGSVIQKGKRFFVKLVR